MFCSKCGNKLVDVAKFCNKCGTPVTSNGLYPTGSSNSSRLMNKSDYYKQGNGGGKYKSVKILSIISIVYQSILAALGIWGCLYLMRFFIAVFKFNDNKSFSNLFGIFIYPVSLVIFYGLFLLLQIRGIKKCSTGRYISALILGFFNTCVCCRLSFNKPLINVPVLIVWLAVHIAIIVLMYLCNKRFKLYKTDHFTNRYYI